LLLQNPDKINWRQFSVNTNIRSLDLLKNKKDSINAFHLFANPNIFEVDYKELKQFRFELNREIIAAALHPRRIQRLLDMNTDIDIEDMCDYL
jgi:hypothetical protein